MTTNRFYNTRNTDVGFVESNYIAHKLTTAIKLVGYEDCSAKAATQH